MHCIKGAVCVGGDGAFMSVQFLLHKDIEYYAMFSSSTTDTQKPKPKNIERN